MYKLRSGKDAMLHKNKMDDYEKRLLLITQNLKQMLIWYYFANRLTAKLPKNGPPNLEDLDRREKSEAIHAFHNLIALGIRKLIDPNRKSWSLTSLFKTIEKQVNYKISNKIEEEIKAFSLRWNDFKQVTDERGAHIGKGQDINTFYSFTNQEKVLLQAIELLDNFVIDEIPYILLVSDGQVDLRKFIIDLKTEP